MKVLIFASNYLPIMDSAARLYSQLAEDLSQMGHKVAIITEHPAPDSPVDKSHEYFLNKFSVSHQGNLTIYRISSLSFLVKIPGGKALRFFFSLILYFFRGIFAEKPDIILVYSPPIYMGVSAYLLSLVKRTKFVFNMQDIHPKVLIDSGVIKNKILIMILSWMEKLIYKKALSFIVYSQGNKDYLLRKGVIQPVYIIPNWVDISVKKYLNGSCFRDEEPFKNKFVLSYAGTMQSDQGLEIIVESAELLKEYEDIMFIIAGEGSSKEKLCKLVVQKKLPNVLFRTTMPKEIYLQFLNESDVCIIPLSPDIPLETVPGKLADIMACGKPLIASVNLNGDAAKIINEAKCGIAVSPGNFIAFKDAVVSLYHDPSSRKQMGNNARIYAENNFSRTSSTKQFEKVLIESL